MLLGLSFQVTFQQHQKFEMFTYVVCFILFMYKICAYCLLKARLMCFKGVLVHLAFFGAIWLFQSIDLAFFAYDYLATVAVVCIALNY